MLFLDFILFPTHVTSHPSFKIEARNAWDVLYKEQQ
jgi:hypothetical protein